MKKIILIILVVVVGWYGNYKYGRHSQAQLSASEYETDSRGGSPTESASDGQFKCDGRTHCSHMTSCAEATFFINNCPNTKMDGNNDGIPCEKQWCK